MLKLALVTDIHNGRESYTKKGGQAVALLRRFAAFVGDYRPDAVIDLGDRVTDVGREEDRQTLGALAEVFAGMPPPRYHLLGNHDCAFLTAGDNEALLATSLGHRSVELGRWRLLFWQASTRMRWPYPARASAADLRWLAEELARSPRPTVVFSHLPLDGASMRSNYYFEANARFAGYENTEEVLAVLRRAGNVSACVAGHVHWNSLSRIDGIPFITLQSLTESFTTGGEAAGAWATLELDPDPAGEVHWRTHGADPIELRVPLGGANRRWVAPLPSFEQRQAQRLAAPADAAPLGRVRGLILDLDGTVYRGGVPLPGAAETLGAAAAAGIELVAVTNNARARPEEYSSKLAAMGIRLPASRIVTSGEATARLLTEHTAAPRVHVVGSEALRRAVLAAGAVETDTAPDFVVAGIDLDLPLSRLAAAAALVADGAQLIATNPDRRLPLAGAAAPETGAVIAFLEAASGGSARIAGKPAPGIFELALSRLGVERDEVAVVGDTLETDIAGAIAAGLRSVLVETGNPIPAGSGIVPTLRVPSIAALGPMLGI